MKKLMLFLMLCVGGALASCGGSDPGDSVSLFKTVKLTAEVSPTPYVVQLASQNTCTNNVISGSVNPAVTDPTVTVSSSTYNTSTAGQVVSLNGYTVTFSPIGSAPIIPAAIANGLQGWIGGTVAPGATSTPVPVHLASAALMDFFATSSNSNISSCTPTEYKYYATINIAGVEESGTNGTVRAVVPVTFTNIQ